MDNSSKQRLVGVMVLIALATIVLPIAFHQTSTRNIALSIPENAPPPPPLSDIQIAPPTQSTPLTQKATFHHAVSEVSANTTSPIQTTAPVVPSPNKDIAQVVSHQTHDVQAPAVSAKAPSLTSTKRVKTSVQTKKQAVVKTIAAKYPAWDIQLGNFSDPRNANQLVKTLRKNGFNAYTKPVISAHKKKHHQSIYWS